MKRIIYIFGIVLLLIVTVLNFLFTARIDVTETVTISSNNILFIIGLFVIGLLIFFVTRFLNRWLYKDSSEVKIELRKFLFWGGFSLYIITNVMWLFNVNPTVGADSIHVATLAQAMCNDNVENVLPTTTYAGISLGEYIQTYQQQIPLAFLYSLFFSAIRIDIIQFLRILNVIGNVLIILALYKIDKQISKKYETNKVLLFTMIFTFAPLLLLSTFIYGDTLGIAFGLISVYFSMRYVEIKKLRYIIFSAISMMIAYMVRMNSLIFIIATVIFLLLYLFNEFTKKTIKEKLINVVIIGFYIIISIIPSSLIKNYYLKEWNLDKDKSYPFVSYLLMSMEESYRQNGWYNEQIAEFAMKEPEKAKEKYPNEIKQRLNYFSKNIGYACNFYIMKIASMWTENTYSTMFNTVGRTYSVMDYINVINSFTGKKQTPILPVEELSEPITFYQKVLLIVSCICCLMFLLQNRRNISLEVLFLLTIFIGGFMFHILWEAKSRYIIPYVIVIMPIAAIKIQRLKTLSI